MYKSTTPGGRGGGGRDFGFVRFNKGPRQLKGGGLGIGRIKDIMGGIEDRRNYGHNWFWCNVVGKFCCGEDLKRLLCSYLVFGKARKKGNFVRRNSKGSGWAKLKVKKVGVCGVRSRSGRGRWCSSKYKGMRKEDKEERARVALRGRFADMLSIGVDSLFVGYSIRAFSGQVR